MNEKQATRLIKVADALRDAAMFNWTFDMSAWGWIQGIAQYRGAPEDEIEWIVEHKCGTPACALGHYAARTDLQRAFRLTVDGGIVEAGPRGGFTDNNISIFDSYIADHFGITAREAYNLFIDEGCGKANTPLQAAKYIENFVCKKGFTVIADV